MSTTPTSLLPSRPCTDEQLRSPRYRRWATQLGENPDRRHRKLWEYCFIADALAEYEMLEPGKRGLGFAVGTEPLASFFASQGATIVATDMDPAEAAERGWVDANEHASSLEALNVRALCAAATMRTHCSFRQVDMTAIPDDLTGFDFVWSCCAFEHLGSTEAGLRFVVEAMRCLRPGGVAVHTTELNCSSDDETITGGDTVLYRRRDLTALADELRADGHQVELDFSGGSRPADHHVDVPPYKHDVHLKLLLEGFVVTSFGLVIRARW